MFKKLFENLKQALMRDRSLMVISLLIAIVIWIVVSITVYPTTDKTIYNVPVKIDLDGTYAQSQNLEVIEMSDETVTVQISGERAKIGSIKAEDLVANVSVTNVMMAREYDLRLDVQSLSGTEFEVKTITPSSVTVAFDKIVSKEFTIEPEVKDLRLASGYISGDPVVSPASVTITGPQDTINSITKVCAGVNPPENLSSTFETSAAELLLYKDSTLISDTSSLYFDKTSFAVQIPVLVRQTLPLDVNIINAPANLDLSWFRSQLVFSAEELDLAAPGSRVKDIERLNIGTINMREVDAGSVFTFSAENFLPADYENLSNVDTVTVTCPSEDIAKKPLSIKGKDIQFINKPAQFEFTPVASGLTLFLVGDSTQLSELTGEDITAQIDLIDFDMQEGDHKMAVDFIISSYDRVWFTGDEGVATPKIYVTAEYVLEEEVIG